MYTQLNLKGRNKIRDKIPLWISKFISYIIKSYIIHPFEVSV